MIFNVCDFLERLIVYEKSRVMSITHEFTFKVKALLSNFIKTSIKFY